MCRVSLSLNTLTFCSMVTNEVVLHELCMFDEMMDIQLSFFFCGCRFVEIMALVYSQKTW
jgi:hypothetical protein